MAAGNAERHGLYITAEPMPVVEALRALTAALADFRAENTVTRFYVCYFFSDSIDDAGNLMSGGTGTVVFKVLAGEGVDIAVADCTGNYF